MALLYYERVIPLNWAAEFLGHNIEHGVVEVADLKQIPVFEFLPERLMTAEFIEDLQHASSYHFLWMYFATTRIPDFNEAVAAAFNETEASARATAPEKVREFIKRFSLARTPLHFSGTILAPNDASESLIAADPMFTLSGLRLVDATKLGWDKLIEFRKDKDSLQKFRRFRTFLYENYTGKPPSYVEDDILRRIDDYEQTIRRWDFETIQGTLNTVLTSKTLAGAMTGTFLSSLVGAPLPAILSAAGGVTVEVGKVLLQLRGRKFALREALRENPISYVVKAKSLEIDKAS